jgi:hypothetical protein
MQIDAYKPFEIGDVSTLHITTIQAPTATMFWCKHLEPSKTEPIHVSQDDNNMYMYTHIS